MKSLIVVYSYHHNNTQKVAEVMAKVLEAKVKSPQQTNPEELNQHDLVGFGAGIDSGKHYKELLDFADALPQITEKKAFIARALKRQLKRIHLLAPNRLIDE